MTKFFDIFGPLNAKAILRQVGLGLFAAALFIAAAPSPAAAQTLEDKLESAVSNDALKADDQIEKILEKINKKNRKWVSQSLKELAKEEQAV